MASASLAYDSRAVLSKVEKSIRAGRSAEILTWLKSKGVAFDSSLGPVKLVTKDQAMAMDDVQSPTITTAS